jgi:hypothetical protein
MPLANRPIVWDVNAEATTIDTAAIPARCLPAGALNRATDLLLEATAEPGGRAEAAARAAVAEYADWCAVDLLNEADELERVAVAIGHGVDADSLAGALGRFAEPDPVMLDRLGLARAPVRVEDPDWLPRHRAVAAAVDGGGGVRGSIVALIPLEAHDLAGDLWFMEALGRRLAQVFGLSGPGTVLGGARGAAELGEVDGHLVGARLRSAL